MSWPELMDPALQEYIEERQAKALRAYEDDTDLLEEHIRQEDNYRAGGYGTRQIDELLQNAVDALTLDGTSGRVEFRIADGALYCANQGAPFARKGLRAVTYSFLSPKDDESIGRFGLGFKSVLGVTDNPQVFSRTISFEFNGPAAAELFEGVETRRGRLPLLRIPMLADWRSAFAGDANLAQMASWATTIVKLPLVRDGQRLREELLSEFRPDSLVFLRSVSTLIISARGADGGLIKRVYERSESTDGTSVTVTDPSDSASTWLFATRTHHPSEGALAELPESMRRDDLVVSYAVNPERRRETGRLWAWFPLRDETTAGGLFNAPWQINEDRTTLVRTSTLNGELLEVCADLFLDVVVRASTSEDPAAHLDLFPARGDEARSDADRFLSMTIPKRAQARAMVPDLTGALQAARSFRGVPDLDRASIPRAAVDLWTQAASRADFPHPSCFSTDQRRARLRVLLRANSASGAEVTLAQWLEELVRHRDRDRITVALELARGLSGARGIERDDVVDARIVPTGENAWHRLRDCPVILIAADDQPTPGGVTFVDTAALSPVSVDILRGFGVHDISGDEVLRTVATDMRPSSPDEAWARLWTAAANATMRSAAEVLTALTEKGLQPRVKNLSGDWVPASRVLADRSFATSIPQVHADPSIVSAPELLEAAGAMVDPAVDVRAGDERMFAEYADAVYSEVADRLVEGQIDRSTLVRRLADQKGAGPASLLLEELSDDERVRWTRSLISHLRRTEFVVQVPVVPRDQSFSCRLQTFELWAVSRHGVVQTSLGMTAPRNALAPTLKDFAWALPVIGDSGVALSLGTLPERLGDVPDEHLRAFLTREGYPAAYPRRLAELLNECASRPSIPAPDLLPAIRGESVVLAPRSEVFVADEDEVVLILEAGWAYIPATDRDELERAWTIDTAEAALSRSLEANVVDDDTPILDSYPTLQDFVTKSLRHSRFARVDSLFQVIDGGIRGTQRKRLQSGTSESGVVLTDRELDDAATLLAISSELSLGLTAADISRVLESDRRLRHNELIASARAAATDADRLLLLVGAETLVRRLPRGLVAAVEARNGKLSDSQIAELFLRVNGNDSVWVLRADLRSRSVAVPEKWDGSTGAQQLVKALGFGTRFAGAAVKKPAGVTQVPGRVDLPPLHRFQQDLSRQIRDLTEPDPKTGEARRGLLYLPTGAGKTRVTVQSILEMMRDGEIESPLLWVAQSQELCEQAIASFSETWRAVGDDRVLDISRFWSGYELDESEAELQVVVAIDDTLASRLGEANYAWLTDRAGMVVIDEAHTAMSRSYTSILEHMGITPYKTARPLLGLTATPFRGRNAEMNERFVRRFGTHKLESLDPEDPIGELRQMRVLSEVDYTVLRGASIEMNDRDREFYSQMKDVSRNLLDVLGQNLTRTQAVVDHITDQVRAHPDWPILVFAASVASAHTIAALLTLAGIEADAVDGSMRRQERRRFVDKFKAEDSKVLVNCDLLTQGFDAPKVRALYIARPTFSPNRYLQMVGRGLRGPANGGTERCLIVNVEDTFEQFGEQLAYNEFDYLWSKK